MNRNVLPFIGALAVGALITLAGCDARTVNIETDPSKTSYSRDARTNICFASVGRAAKASMSDMADSFSITSVPCSAEVLALVPESQRGNQAR